MKSIDFSVWLLIAGYVFTAFMFAGFIVAAKWPEWSARRKARRQAKLREQLICQEKMGQAQQVKAPEPDVG